MKTTKLLLALVLIFCGPSTFAQEDLQLTKKDSMVVSSWMFGVGINIVDDAGSEFDDVLNAGDNWNMVPFTSRISIGKYFKNDIQHIPISIKKQASDTVNGQVS